MKALLRPFALIVISIGLIAAARSLYLGHTLARPSQILDALTSSVVIYQRIGAGQYHFADLFGLHNEHRIPLQTFLSLIDGRYFDFTNRFLLSVIYTSLASIALLIAILTGRSAAFFFPALGLAWGVVQYENLGWGFEVHFPLVHLFALLCFICVAVSLRSMTKPAAWGWMLLALVCDGLSVLTLSSGLIIGFAVFVLPVVMRRFNLAFVGFMVAHIAATAMYLSGEKPFLPPEVKTTAWHVVRFFLRCLGTLARDGLHAPFQSGPLIAGLILFVAALGVGLLMMWNAQMEKRPAEEASAILLALISFIVLEVAAITVGRIHADPDQAIVSRYATHSVILAMALLGLYWRTFANFRAVTVAAAGVFIVLSNMPFSVARWRYFIADQDRAVFAVMNGVFEANDAILPLGFANRGTIIKETHEFLRARNKGPFARSSFYLRGIPPIPPKCRGEVSVSRRAENVKLSGWVAAPTLPLAPAWLEALSSDGKKLLGYTRPTSQRPDVKRVIASSDDMFGFELFLPPGSFEKDSQLIATFAPRVDLVACVAVLDEMNN
jgi:hypothetical protein